MGQARDLSNWIDGSHRVGGIPYGHESRAVAQFAFEVLKIQRAVLFADVGYPNRHTLFLERLPRREVGVMIESGQENSLEEGIAFYRRLAAKSDDELSRGALPREELEEGLQELLKRVNSPDS